MEMEMKAGTTSRSGLRFKFDVFLSFQRDDDTGENFTGRLCDAFSKKDVRVVFRDYDVMKHGDELDPSLVEAMADSVASVVFISPNYAKSHLSLEELATLFDLNASLKRPILPIFYKVDPSHVRKQSHHFKKDFDNHSEDFSEEKVDRWKRAMTLIGNLAGFVYSVEDSIDDNNIIGPVVKSVLDELINTPEKVGDYTVGLESRLEELMKLMDFKSSSDVQVVGVYGMGGIGKTTLAKFLYNKIVGIGNFKHRVFMSNIREKSSEHGGLVNLQRTFINELFRQQPEIDDVNRGRETIRGYVHEKKILAVLDDVDDVDQVHALFKERRWYGDGSLIIITTRDESILSKLSVNQYEVKCLNEMQALKLFSYHSLRKENPKETLLELSKKIVQITGLLPLAIEVFGSLLYGKDENEWQAQMEKLKKIRPHNLQDILAVSFNSLDNEEKQVFLDIACLFLKMEIKKEEVVDILKGCGFAAVEALSVLRQKSLVKILEDGNLWMHDQIRDMGRQMVLDDSLGDPGMRSRLWDRAEILNVLNNMKGTTSIEGIVLDFKKKLGRDLTAAEIALSNLQNNPGPCSLFNYLMTKFLRFPAEETTKSFEASMRVEPFESMKKLRLLQINNVRLEGNLKLLPSELKWIQWKGCPLENLPSDFSAGELAVLDLSESGIRRVQGLRSNKVAGNLKVVNLRGCHSLEAIPDLSNHKTLEKLVLERCNLLVKVPRSVGNLRTLLHLDLRNCSNLSEFHTDVSGLEHLEKLLLSGCSNLSVLPENIGVMRCLEELLLDGTAIKNLPESISNLENLVKLSLSGCRFIKQLPLKVGELTSLEELYLDDTALENLPDSIGSLKKLQKLHFMRCTSLFKIPKAINDLISLKELFINGSSVVELPLNPGSLQSLVDFSAGQCKSLQQVPSSIGGLNSLSQLQLDGTPIENLPTEIGALHFVRRIELRNCMSLRFLPESIGDLDTLRSLLLEGSNIEELPESFGKLENLVLLRMNKCKKLQRLPESFGNLTSLHHLHMQETSVTELPENFGNLSKLRVLKMLKKPLFRQVGNTSDNITPGTSEEETQFVKLPDSFSNLKLLEQLDARSCRISGNILDDFENLSSMEELDLGNNYFHSLPSSLKGLSNLRKLSMYDCQELKRLPPLPRKLEELNLANCFALETISDLSELHSLQELNLTNCGKVVDVPGIEHLTALKRLYMTGCNSTCSREVKKSLSKVSLKKLQNLSIPGSTIPDWFSPSPVTFSAHPNKELKGIILAVVVALNHETIGDYQLPNVVEIQAQVLKLGFPIHTHTLNLCGVPRTNDDQLHICRYPVFNPIVSMLKDGYTIQMKKREPPYLKDVELKAHGIYVVYEGADDMEGDEEDLTDTQLTVSQKLANFFGSLGEGEASSEVEAAVT